MGLSKEGQLDDMGRSRIEDADLSCPVCGEEQDNLRALEGEHAFPAIYHCTTCETSLCLDEYDDGYLRLIIK